MKKIVLLGLTTVGCVAAGALPEVGTEQADDWFYPPWAEQARSADLVDIRPLPNYRFMFLDMFGGWGDVVNKDMPR